MAVEWSAHVWKHSPYSGTALLIHLALADFANKEGRTWPSMKSLAEYARLESEKQVRRHVHQMIEDKTISLLAPGKGRGNSNLYQLNVLPARKPTSTSSDGVDGAGGPENLPPQGGFPGEQKPPAAGRVSAPKTSRAEPKTSRAPVSEGADPYIEPLQPKSARAVRVAADGKAEKAEDWKPPAKVLESNQWFPKGMRLAGGYVEEGTGTNAVQVYHEFYPYYPPDDRLTHKQIEALVKACPDLDRLRTVMRAYVLTPFRSRNVGLIVDWYETGTPAERGKAQGSNAGGNGAALFSKQGGTGANATTNNHREGAGGNSGGDSGAEGTDSDLAARFAEWFSRAAVSGPPAAD